MACFPNFGTCLSCERAFANSIASPQPRSCSTSRHVLFFFPRENEEEEDILAQVRQCNLPGISPVANCPRLSLLDASWNTHVTTVQPIVQCTALTELILRGCSRLHDVGELSHLPQLTALDVSFTPVTALPDLPSLRILGIFACHRLQACPQLSCTLNHLDAGSCRVDDAWLEQISCCTIWPA